MCRCSHVSTVPLIHHELSQCRRGSLVLLHELNLDGRKMVERMEETFDELEQHIVLVADAGTGTVLVAEDHMTVGTPVEVEKRRMIVGIAAGIVEVEVRHMTVDTVDVVAANRMPMSHLEPFCILVLVDESRMPTDHPSAVHPYLAILVVCNLVVERLSVLVDMNLVQPMERAYQLAVESAHGPSYHHPTHVF